MHLIKIKIFSFLLLVVIASPCMSGDGPILPVRELKEPMELDEALSVLQQSQDPEQLAKAAVSLCRIGTPTALDSLATALRDPVLLARLDTEMSFHMSTEGLRVYWITEEIGKLSTPQAQDVLLKLARDKTFTDEFSRINCLIDACRWIQNPSPELLAFLDSMAAPKNGLTGGVVTALARIGSPEALALIEKRVLSADYQTGTKAGWFTHYLITVRNNANVVSFYRQLLSMKNQDVLSLTALDKRIMSKEIKFSLRDIIIQSLFDYRGREWYKPSAYYPRPPKREDASSEVLRELLEIADMALKLDITPETREGVLKAQQEIQEILQKRSAE